MADSELAKAVDVIQIATFCHSNIPSIFSPERPLHLTSELERSTDALRRIITEKSV